MSKDRNTGTPKSPSRTPNCQKCNKIINARDQKIECDDCSHFFHQKCTDLTTAEFNCLTKGNKNIKYHCINCLEDGEGSKIKNLESRVKKLEIDSETAKQDSSQMQDIIRQLQTQNDNIQRQNDAIIKFFDNYKGENLENTIKAHVNEITDSKTEIEEKKNCLIVFNMDETEGENAIQDDVDNVKKLFKVTNPDLDTSGLNKEHIFRLKKKTNPEEPKSKKNAPIKVKLPNPKIKMQIISNGKKLKGHDKFGKVGIQLDMTKAEQEKHKALREELKNRRDNGEDVMIFDGSVILKNEREKYAALRAKRAAKND